MAKAIPNRRETRIHRKNEIALMLSDYACLYGLRREGLPAEDIDSEGAVSGINGKADVIVGGDCARASGFWSDFGISVF
jgi:hypothetical protein